MYNMLLYSPTYVLITQYERKNQTFHVITYLSNVSRKICCVNEEKHNGPNGRYLTASCIVKKRLS